MCTLNCVSVLLITTLHLVSCKVLYIVPNGTQNDTTVVGSSMTISYFARNPTKYVDSNTSLYITGGSHYLDKNIIVSDTVEFSMLAVRSNETVEINCGEHVKFTFSKVTNVTISGLMFTGCNENRVMMVGQLIVRGTFFNGTKSGSTSLLIYSSTVVMTDTSFISNGIDMQSFTVGSRQVTSESTLRGGALYLSSSKLFLYGCQFEENAADTGGVLFSENQSSITIKNSTFTSNVARRDGGVFACNGGAIQLQDNTTFTDNIAGDDGGIVHIRSNFTLNVSNCQFNNNKADDSGGVFYGRENGIVIISNSTFYNNTVEEYGGSVYVREYVNISIGESSTFMNNLADYGGVLIATRQGSITIDDSTFIGNHADTDGGTLYTRTSINLRISNCRFFSNEATNDGIVVGADESHVVLDNSTFTHNSAGFNGGAVSLYDSSSLRMTNCNISNSTAGDSGGVAYGRRNSSITIRECRANNNVAENSGGALYAQEDSNVVIHDSEFNDNEADYGGAVRVYIKSSLHVYSSSFSRNKGSLSGGTLAAYKNSIMIVDSSNFIGNEASFGSVGVAYYSNMTILYCHFSNNKAQLGGVFRVLQVDAVFIGNRFQYNTANSGGVLYTQSITVSIEGCFFANNNATSDGGAIDVNNGVVTIENTTFENNHANANGGVLYISNCTVNITNSTFNNSTALNDGGVYYANSKSQTIFYNSTFLNSTAEHSGGVMFLLGYSSTTVEECNFTNSTARDNGGVFSLLQSTMTVVTSMFNSSTTRSSGGVAHMTNSTFTVEESSFMFNSADNNGGVLNAASNSTINLVSCNFLNNNASNGHGGVLYLVQKSSGVIVDSTFKNNTARDSGGVLSGSLAIVRVSQSIFDCNVAKTGAAFSATQDTIISFLSCAQFQESCQLTAHHNKTEICHNTAQEGSGIYLKNSKLIFEQEMSICQNEAMQGGGGVYAEDSSIWISSAIDFYNNEAMEGGGMSLTNSKLYDTNDDQYSNSESDEIAVVDFTFNRAKKYGGAIYVNDDTAESNCSSDPSTNGCFFQNITTGLKFNFNNNSVDGRFGGKDLFGGLLDRCSVVNEEYSSQLEPEGAAHFKNISNIETFDTVSSRPVRVFLCTQTETNCGQHTSMNIKLGKSNEFKISLVAVNQIGQKTPATIHSRLITDTGSTLEDQLQVAQLSMASCSEVEFLMSFPGAGKYKLIVFAEGPCDNRGISSVEIDINVEECSCPVGFMQDKNSTKCECVCDQKLSHLIKNLKCNSSDGSIEREGEYWITYFNETDDNTNNSYFVYPHCPLDYCQPASAEVHIKLGDMNGSDAQCTEGRGGVLCGKCTSGYCLSLGSSTCIAKYLDANDHRYYIKIAGLLFAAIVAGIVLVALLLFFNLTVAVGTLNSIIFYANIINANKSIYFRQTDKITKATQVFISWLNLDIGIDVCFYNTMNTYEKTWLKLGFPAYIISIVILIILISSCSSKFSNFIGKKNPVATLATLILLSYTTFLQTIVTSFSYNRLQYKNYTIRWFPDANEELTGKHMALICVTVVILILGLLYTALLFSWQWLLNSPNSKVFKWTRNQKLHTFVDTYHTPYTARHRYWTGLLLLVRVVVYAISSFTTSADPRITLLLTVSIMCCLYLYKTAFTIRVYKNWLLSAMESFVYFNIAMFTMITWYNNDQETSENLKIVSAYISVGSIFILFLMVIVFHVYRYSNSRIYRRGQNTKLVRAINTRLKTDDLQIDSSWTRSRNTYKLFHAIDKKRKESAYDPPIISSQSLDDASSSVVSLENCDDHSEVLPAESENVAKSDVKKPRAKSHVPQGNSNKKISKYFSVTRSRKAEPTCIPVSLFESTTTPLLEEDEV